MRDQVQRYLDHVLSHVKCQDVHADVRMELESHITDRIDALREAGFSEEDAVEGALHQMGDPTTVGQGLHRAHRPRTDWKLMTISACLVLAGIWIMFAASANEGVPFFEQHLLWSALGIVLASGFFFFDYRRLRPLRWPLFGTALLLLLPLALLRMNTVWQQIWLDTAGNPFLFVPGLAALFADWDWSERPAPWKAAALGVIPPMLYLAVGGIRHVPVYVVLWSIMLLLSGPRLRHLAPVALTGLSGVTLLGWRLMSTPYQRMRLLVWLQPGRDPRGAGYAYLQSVQALKDAGLWGHGPLAQLTFVPQVESHFVFTYLVHTLGWVGGGAVCVLAALFLVRLIKVARQSKDRFGLLLTAGVCAVFAMQFIWSTAITAGLAPAAAVDLPFFSFGRHQVIQLAAVGMALSVFRRKDLATASRT